MRSDKINRTTDEGHDLFVLHSYFFTLLHFLWFKFKRFNQEVFCEKAALKFLLKKIWTFEKCLWRNSFHWSFRPPVFNITKEELLYSFFQRTLPAYLENTFQRALLNDCFCVLWYNDYRNATFLILTIKNLKTDETLHSTDEGEGEEISTFSSSL